MILILSNGSISGADLSLVNFPIVLVIIVFIVVLEALARLRHRVVHQYVGEIVVFIDLLVKVIEQFLVLPALPVLAQGEQPQQGQPYQLSAGHVTEPQPVGPHNQRDA